MKGSHFKLGMHIKYSNAIDVSTLKPHAEQVEWSKAWKVFNPDNKRLQIRTNADDPLRLKVIDFLSTKTALMRGRVAADAFYMKSLSGCRKQEFHIDFTDKRINYGQKLPLSVILALDDETKIELPNETIYLNKNDLFVFDANTVHAGSAYMKDNIRLFMYIETPEISSPNNETYIVR